MHRGTTCTRSSQAEASEKGNIWEDFRDRIKPIVVWMKRERDKEKEILSWTKSLKMLIEKVNTQRDPGMQQLVELMEKKWSNEEKTMSVRKMVRVVKQAKVPTWMKDMALEMLERQLDIWKTSNTDVPESTQFQDLVELLKLNKEIKGLAKYVGFEYCGETEDRKNCGMFKDTLWKE